MQLPIQGGYHTQQLLHAAAAYVRPDVWYLLELFDANKDSEVDCRELKLVIRGVRTQSQNIWGSLLKKLKDLKADHGLLAYDDFVMIGCVALRSPPFCLRRKYCHLSLHSDRVDFNVCLQHIPAVLVTEEDFSIAMRT